jgi:hypothetical protein
VAQILFTSNGSTNLRFSVSWSTHFGKNIFCFCPKTVSLDTINNSNKEKKLRMTLSAVFSSKKDKKELAMCFSDLARPQCSVGRLDGTQATEL